MDELQQESLKAATLAEVSLSPQDQDYWRGYRIGLWCEKKGWERLSEIARQQHQRLLKGYYDGRAKRRESDQGD